MNRLVIIKGGGDLATGIAHRLFRSGFDILITELVQPTVIRRSVAFANAIFEGKMEVEGVTAVSVQSSEVERCLQQRVIPVVVDPPCSIAQRVKPWGIVDAILAKKNMGTTMQGATVVVGVGPGFTAGVDVHRVVETMRGHDLGRVLVSGAAQPNTGIPGDIGGYTLERLVSAPRAGIFRPEKKIGDLVAAGEVLGYVEGMAVVAAIPGVLRGLLYEGLPVTKNMKIGDVDPRAVVEHCWTISDKARAIGGGVLEALLMAEPCFQLPIVSNGSNPREHTDRA
jgi:xanthine dehydrogenase accessory factor